jgi:hypothetical protein
MIGLFGETPYRPIPQDKIAAKRRNGGRKKSSTLIVSFPTFSFCLFSSNTKKQSKETASLGLK